MKPNFMSLMDLLTIILFVPFSFLVLVGTGLALYAVVDRDTSDTARAQEYAAPRIRRYIVLPPVTPAAVEASGTELLGSEPDQLPAETHEQAVQVVDTAPEEIQVEPISAVAATANETVTTPSLVEETGATADAAAAEADVPAQAEAAAPADLALAEPQLPETVNEEALPDAAAAPAVTTPAEEPAPAEASATPPPPPPPPPPTPTPAPREPASVPDASFFDDLLEQVK